MLAVRLSVRASSDPTLRHESAPRLHSAEVRKELLPFSFTFRPPLTRRIITNRERNGLVPDLTMLMPSSIFSIAAGRAGDKQVFHPQEVLTDCLRDGQKVTVVLSKRMHTEPDTGRPVMHPYSALAFCDGMITDTEREDAWSELNACAAAKEQAEEDRMARERTKLLEAKARTMCDVLGLAGTNQSWLRSGFNKAWHRTCANRTFHSLVQSDAEVDAVSKVAHAHFLIICEMFNLCRGRRSCMSLADFSVAAGRMRVNQPICAAQVLQRIYTESCVLFGCQTSTLDAAEGGVNQQAKDQDKSAQAQEQPLPPMDLPSFLLSLVYLAITEYIDTVIGRRMPMLTQHEVCERREVLRRVSPAELPTICEAFEMFLQDHVRPYALKHGPGALAKHVWKSAEVLAALHDSHQGLTRVFHRYASKPRSAYMQSSISWNQFHQMVVDALITEELDLGFKARARELFMSVKPEVEVQVEEKEDGETYPWQSEMLHYPEFVEAVVRLGILVYDDDHTSIEDRMLHVVKMLLSVRHVGTTTMSTTAYTASLSDSSFAGK